MATGFKSASGTDAANDSGAKSAPEASGGSQLDPQTQGLEDSFNAPSATDANRPAPKNPSFAKPGFSKANGPTPAHKNASTYEKLAAGGGKRPLTSAQEGAAASLAAGTYKRSGDQKWAAKSIGFASKHRKGLMGGGGLAGVLIALMLGAAALLPLKIESIIKNFYGHEMGRAQSYVDRRVQAILFRYIYERATGTLASDGFYTKSSLIKTIYGNLRINQFENKLLNEKGIKIEKTGARSIRLTLQDGTKFEAASSADLMQHIGVDLNGRAARNAIKDMVDQTYHPLQFLKRRHMRQFLVNAYNIRRFSLKKQEDNKDPKKPDVPSNIEQDVQSAELDPATAETTSAVDCLIGGPCADDTNRRNPDGTSTEKPPLTTQDHNGDVAAAENTAGDASKKGILDSYQALKQATNAAILKGLTKIFNEAIAKTIIKAVPVLGWIALAADIDHFFWDGTIGKIVVHLHDVQYAAAASTWMTIADQFKAGQFTGSQVNAFMLMLQDVEKSGAVQRILFHNNQAGLQLTAAQRVGSDSAGALPGDGGLCGVKWFFFHGTDPAPPSNVAGPDYWTWEYRQAMNAPPTFIHTALCTIRIPLDAVSAALNSILGGLLSFVMKIAIDTLDALASAATGHAVDIMAFAQSALSWLIDHVFTPVVTGREVGAALGNIIDTGLDVIGNQMCRDVMGCANIPYAVAYQQDLAIANDDRDQLRQLSPIAALTNTDYPESFGSQMLAMMPSTPGAAIGDLGSTGLAMISNPFHLFATTVSGFFPSAGAALPPATEPNGVQQTGMNDATLNDDNLHLPTTDIAGPPGPDGKPTAPDGKIDQYDCPVVSNPNVENPCLLDVTAAQTLCAGLTSNDDGGLGGHGDPGPCGNIATPLADDSGVAPPAVGSVGTVANGIGPFLMSFITGKK